MTPQSPGTLTYAFDALDVRTLRWVVSEAMCRGHRALMAHDSGAAATWGLIRSRANAALQLKLGGWGVIPAVAPTEITENKGENFSNRVEVFHAGGAARTSR